MTVTYHDAVTSDAFARLAFGKCWTKTCTMEALQAKIQSALEGKIVSILPAAYG